MCSFCRVCVFGIKVFFMQYGVLFFCCNAFFELLFIK